jgi:hypothetical protein
LGLTRVKFKLGKAKIEVMVEILRARTVQNKPKLLDQVRDVIRLKHYCCAPSKHSKLVNSRGLGDQKSDVRGQKSENSGQSLYCSMSILLSRKSKTKAIPSNGRSSVWIIPSRNPARLNVCDFDVVVSA